MRIDGMDNSKDDESIEGGDSGVNGSLGGVGKEGLDEVGFFDGYNGAGNFKSQ